MRKKTLPEKLAFEKSLTKLAKYSLFAKEISFICMLSLQGHKRKKNTRIRRVLLFHVESCKLVLKASSISSWTHTLACCGKRWVCCGDVAIKGFEKQGKVICLSIHKWNFSKWRNLVSQSQRANVWVKNRWYQLSRFHNQMKTFFITASELQVPALQWKVFWDDKKDLAFGWYQTVDNRTSLSSGLHYPPLSKLTINDEGKVCWQQIRWWGLSRIA